MDEPVQTGSEQHPEPTGQPEGDHLPHSLAWLWWIPIFLLVYVLSIGPAAKLATAFPAVHPALAAVYAPLGVLARKCPPFDRAASWYLERIWHV